MTVKVLLQCAVYLKPFLCFLSLKSFAVKGREREEKTGNTTSYSLYKETTSSKAKRDTMTQIWAVTGEPVSLTINEKVMTSIEYKEPISRGVGHFRPQHLCCLKGLTYLPSFGAAGYTEECLWWSSHIESWFSNRFWRGIAIKVDYRRENLPSMKLSFQCFFSGHSATWQPHLSTEM